MSTLSFIKRVLSKAMKRLLGNRSKYLCDPTLKTDKDSIAKKQSNESPFAYIPANYSSIELRRTIWVPLKEIDHFLPNDHLNELFNGKKVHYSNLPGFFWRGDWDRKALQIEPHYFEISSSFRSVYQILKRGNMYKQSDEYLEKLEQIRKEGRSARGTSREELNAYFEGLIKLADTIDKEGYKMQSETGGDPIDEIGVFIGRDGKILKAEDKFCGTHRFAIASVLGIEKIPVAILAVHEDLMELYLNALSDPASLLKRLSQQQHISQ